MPPGYAVDTITSTSNVLQLGISEKLGIFVEYLSTMVTAIIVAFTWNWLLTLVTASAILFILLSVGILVPQIVKGQTRVTKVSRGPTTLDTKVHFSDRTVGSSQILFDSKRGHGSRPNDNGLWSGGPHCCQLLRPRR